MASHLYVGVTNIFAKKAWDAYPVEVQLRRQKHAIMTVYRNEQVQEAHVTTDTRGNPYDFRTEMARDEIAYTTTLAALSGNTALLDDAIVRMNDIIAAAVEPTAKTLARFEQQRLIYQREPTDESFAVLTSRFTDAVNASYLAGKWERVATIGARYAADARSTDNIKEMSRGLRIAAGAITEKPSVVKDTKGGDKQLPQVKIMLLLHYRLPDQSEDKK